MSLIIKKSSCLLLIVMILTAGSAWATGLREDILKIHATIVPKMVLMDYRLKDKLADHTILVMVLCRQKDCYYARHFKSYLGKKYRQGINNIPVKVRIVPYGKFMKGQAAPATIYYLLPASGSVIRHAAHHIPGSPLIFAYNCMDLNNDANISIKIGYKVRPVINLAALKARDISLRPAIIKISEMFPSGTMP